MRATTKTVHPAGISVGALWSLFWRALLLTPAVVLFGLLFVLAWTLLFALPLMEVLFLWDHQWFAAVLTPVVWSGLFLLTRLRWFRTDRRDFPNDQENV